MSVLIKGMEKPEHCGYCRFRYDGICHALQKTQYSMNECPLVVIDDAGLDDTISRQAAIDALAKLVPYAICDESTESYTNGLTDTYNLICQLPSAERRGRWINGNEGIWNAVILPKCSICGETFYEMNVNINGEYPYNYCPNCGARMEVE